MGFSKKFMENSPLKHRKRGKPHCHAGKRKRVKGSRRRSKVKFRDPFMSDVGSECHGDDTMA